MNAPNTAVINTRAYCSEAPEFKSRYGDRLSWLKFFVVFLSLSTKMADNNKNNHYHVFPYLLNIIDSKSPYHSMQYNLDSWISAVKWTKN